MHFSTITTVLAVVLGASASPTKNIELQTTKNVERQITTGVLLALTPEIAGKISSIYPLFGSSIITIFSNANCQGGWQLDVVAPGINNLEDFGFNDMARGIKANFRR
ncbi:hypothetical protein yc1106_04942 [Curvularia clavata]|uniref:Uncharacterized protein n=1 Tax=Curvularia clavata TaxID=95742 RepID=A0A9Q8ZBD2_CURCL|nr:hypothetical protein yc1106_04942 [Curvularia clavata]